MDFFSQQRKARRQSRWIIVCFVAITLVIIAAVDLIVLLLLGLKTPLESGVGYITQSSLSGALSFTSLANNLSNNASLLAGSSLLTGGVIGLASLGKIASLRRGGGKVAVDLGGVIVTPDTRDPLRRRLYNVVEEIAIASGIPVPQVFVLENEPGINAFAAGYSSSDAAVAVTQGTLEKLNRSELQGVIAHEFSHIFNGDMRINIRMMGVIFGILVIAIIGRKFMHSARYSSRSSKSNGSSLAAIGFALAAIGYIGLFFSRWMKAALSRQREYLADASAVQFTREPEGIAGALKKIAAYQHASYLQQDPEEVSHMLFGAGYRSLMFATHPPLPQRIERIEKHFDANEIEHLAEKLAKEERREHVQAQQAQHEEERRQLEKKSTTFDIDAMLANIGNPEFERILAAAMLTASIPDELTNAAHSIEWAPEVLFYCLLNSNDTVRHKQLLAITERVGEISEQKVSHLISVKNTPNANQRLPLLEMCFPAIKRRPIEELEKIIETVDVLIAADKRVDSFEYLLSSLIKTHLQESLAPAYVKHHGRKKLDSCINELTTVVSILAAHGHDINSTKGIQNAQHAFREGMAAVEVHHTNLTFIDDWQSKLDAALQTLNKLQVEEKQKVVKALANTVLSDHQLVSAEHEMMRAICLKIHVPLPILESAEVVT